MAEAVANQEGAPAQPASTPTPPAQEGRTYTQAQIDALVAAGRREAEAKLSDTAKQLEEARQRAMTEDEKKISEAVKARERELGDAHSAELRKMHAKLALAGKVQEKAIDMVAALIPADTPLDQIAAEVDAILSDQPYLRIDAAAPGVPPGGTPATGSPNHYTAERIRELRESGEWPKHEAAVMAAIKANRITPQ